MELDEIPSFVFKQKVFCGYEREVFSFHINFYSNWNVFYDDDFIIQIIKHALEFEVAILHLIGVPVIKSIRRNYLITKGSK